MEYVIDFDRVNELCTHPNDNPKDGISGIFVKSLSRQVIKEYLSIYTDSITNHGKVSKKYDDNVLENVIETLHFNKILVSKADIRDNKINQVLQK
jgi:hypothetical protein